MNFGARLDRLRIELGAAGQMLVTNPLNVRWLTGFTGSNGQVLVTAETATLLTDSRYVEQAGEEVPAQVEVVVATPLKGDRMIDHVIGRSAGSKLGLESDDLTHARFLEIATELEEHSLAPMPVEGTIAKLRRIKDDDEVAALRQAAKTADDALAAALPYLRAGQTELKVARQIEWEMAERGSERRSFETILASGPNGAKPHARPSDRVLVDGDLVVIDFGATIDGYGSDMTRTVVVGGKPTPDQKRWYQNVWDAQRAGVEATAVGNDLRSIHDVTLEHLSSSGQNGVYAHGTGHGVGLFIHENPILSVRATGLVEERMALTVEPGAYIPGVGGVRVEDLVITTPDGPMTLTNFPKGLTADQT